MKTNIKINPTCDENCPVRASLALLSGKWTLMILFQINENVMRYGEIKNAIVGISEKMLIQELKMLVKNKLVTRKIYREVPPKVEYKLTELGKKTLPIIDKLAKFGLENLVKQS